MRSNTMHNTFRRKLLAAAVVACFVNQPALANPTGGAVASGSAAFSTSGSTLTVTNTPNAIINWASFSIPTNETVKFVQQSAASAVLNRVTGSDPSQILGALQSNGRIFLLNPNGIVFGAGARIDVNGLVASTLNMSDADFLGGRMRFNADRTAPGGVTNAGQITTPNGGFVYLLAPSVENSGVITTPSGEAILAAGNSVEIVDSTNLNQRVLVSATSQDVNLSQLMTQSNGNIFSVLNSGKVSANTAVQDATGKIFFKSAGSLRTAALSVVEAKGDNTANGGHIQAFASGKGLYAGSFDVSGKNGGFLETSGGYLNVDSATINLRALDSNGTGGSWLLDPYDIVIYSSTNSNIADYDASSNYSYSGSGGGATSYISNSTINRALASGNVIIETTGDSAGTGNGDITLTSGTTISGGNGYWLQLNAYRDINVNGSISMLSNDAKLLAGRDINVSATGSISGTNLLLTATRNFSLASGGQLYAHAYAPTVTSTVLGITASDISINGSATSSSSYGSATIGMSSGTMTVNGGNISASTWAASGEASIGIAAPNLSITGGSSLSASAYGGGSGYLGIAGSSVNINNSSLKTNASAAANSTTNTTPYADMSVFGINDLTVSGSTLSTSAASPIHSSILLVSQNMHITGASRLYSGYIGLDYEPNFIKTHTADFFAFISSATVLVDGSSTVGNATTIGLGISGNNVTVAGGASLTAGNASSSDSCSGCMHGIVTNDLKLDSGASMYAQTDMLLEVGGHLYLNNNSHITVSSPLTLYFNFPLQANDGWFVDGIAGAFSGASGSSIKVNGTTPTLNSTLFVTYGGISTITSVTGATNKDLLTSSEISTSIQDALVADNLTGEDFFGAKSNGNEDQKEKKEDQPQQCS